MSGQVGTLQLKNMLARRKSLIFQWTEGRLSLESALRYSKVIGVARCGETGSKLREVDAASFMFLPCFWPHAGRLL